MVGVQGIILILPLFFKALTSVSLNAAMQKQYATAS
jgi:hypothetical protein